MTIRYRLGERSGRHDRASTGPIVDDHCLVPARRQTLRQNAHDHISGTARRKGDKYSYVSRRECLAVNDLNRKDREHESQHVGRQSHESPPRSDAENRTRRHTSEVAWTVCRHLAIYQILTPARLRGYMEGPVGCKYPLMGWSDARIPRSGRRATLNCYFKSCVTQAE